MRFAVASRRVATPEGLRPAAVVIHDGRIASIEERAPAGVQVIDAGEEAVLPGIVDTHAHINEPGRTEWEGFESATRAAAAGGITTVIDMPLNSIPATTTAAALEAKARSAEGHCAIDYGFWGGVVPGNTAELEPMIRAGIFGFKAFLCPSGVDEFPMAGEADLRAAMPVLARHGVPLLVHAELEGRAPAAGLSYRSYLESRPARWEVEAIRLVIRLARETGCRTHIVHLSAAEALPELAQARARGVPVTAETCPHYLHFEAEAIADGATHFKCAPPIRGRDNRERLWRALKEGELEFVVSDHSPCTPALKAGDFGQAWGGIAGLQFSLPVVWSGMRSRGFGLEDLSRLMSARTARFLGLEGRKGALRPGADADLICFDPDAAFTVEPGAVLHRHKLTPYSGLALHGRVSRTFVGGHRVFEHAGFPSSAARGRRLLRPPSLPSKGVS